MTETAQYWIEHLNLQPHPEGGYYKEVFRSAHEVTRAGATAVKQACTSIYYLLEGRDFSDFHRLASDELWYFHKGAPLHIHVIDNDGAHTLIELSDTATGSLQAIIPPNTWFASEIPSGSGFALVSCAVAPGFDFAEFEMAKQQELIKQYPEHRALLERLCRE
ncbi:cupin domain-containing protein [Mucilaginibacter sp. UR6-11]|uniref:cupin domain-containing protein n=1 Tax=Mucilaginibacter sp. UR6-11 TaxID=1435644 RepID=UPI001E44FEC3|nr:cupin domain-containing protein [Mucilaginibacter sp. UR6-11]MCC8424356.1 cupin domain-containing protein [Mucilaginibacter sp. UR6-11]